MDPVEFARALDAATLDNGPDFPPPPPPKVPKYTNVAGQDLEGRFHTIEEISAAMRNAATIDEQFERSLGLPMLFDKGTQRYYLAPTAQATLNCSIAYQHRIANLRLLPLTESNLYMRRMQAAKTE
jgi:hypothetical protein